MHFLEFRIFQIFRKVIYIILIPCIYKTPPEELGIELHNQAYKYFCNGNMSIHIK